MKTVLALGHDHMGHGDADLGRRILGTFLRKSGPLQLTAVVLYNAGVKLVAEGSPVLVELQQLHDNGVDLRPCATCVDHYGVRERIRVGSICTMDDVITEMSRADKVITL